MRKILFSDGEAVEHGDFNTFQDQTWQQLIDNVLWHLAANYEHPDFNNPKNDDWNPGSGLFGTGVRGLRQAGAVELFSTSTIRIYGGLFLQVADGPIDLAANIGLAASAATQFISPIAATASGQFRRDLVECRITLNSNPQVSRDFEDAVTGALTSQLVTKTSDLEVEFQVVTGSEFATQADADDPANLPDTTSGWHAVAAYLVTDTGIDTDENTLWDYRQPFGSWRKRFSAADFLITTGGAAWTHDVLNGRITSTGGGDICRLDVLPQIPTDPGVVGADTLCPTRISKLILYADFAGLPGAAGIEIRRAVKLGSTKTLCEYVNHVSGTAGLIGTRLDSLSALPFELYNRSDSASEDGPLWTNGKAAAYSGFTENYEFLTLLFESSLAADAIYGLDAIGWGGF